MIWVSIENVGIAGPLGESAESYLHSDCFWGRDNNFDTTHYLGKRGWRYFTEPTKYLLSAFSLWSGSHEDYNSEKKGVFLGTNLSDVKVRKDLFENISIDGYQGVSPAWASNSSVNIPASTLSIQEKFQGNNTTFTSKILAGFDALWYGYQKIVKDELLWGTVGACEDTIDSSSLVSIGGGVLFEIHKISESKKASLSILKRGRSRNFDFLHFVQNSSCVVGKGNSIDVLLTQKNSGSIDKIMDSDLKNIGHVTVELSYSLLHSLGPMMLLAYLIEKKYLGIVRIQLENSNWIIIALKEAIE